MENEPKKSMQASPLNNPPKDFLEAESPFHWYENMRREHPVRHDPIRGCWDIFRYDDVKGVLANYASFSSRTHENEISIISMDPPKHKLHRSIVSNAFTPKAIEDLAPRIQEIASDLLDQAASRGKMDVIADLAFPLPTIVIAELLGVPREDRGQFKEWSDEAVRALDAAGGESPEQFRQRKGQNAQEMFAYFTGIIEDKRKNPANDLVSALLAAKVEGQSLDMPELLRFCFLLLVAGNETTTNLIGNAMVCFIEDPDVQSRLRHDPGLLPAAIEEALRYRSPVQSFHRLCVRDTEVAGTIIPAGQPVIVWLGSANRDEAVFEQADRFDPRRPSNPHIAFGHGPHFCLGAPLARLEATIALRLVFERLPQLSFERGTRLQPIASSLIYGYKSIPVTF